MFVIVFYWLCIRFVCTCCILLCIASAAYCSACVHCGVPIALRACIAPEPSRGSCRLGSLSSLVAVHQYQLNHHEGIIGDLFMTKYDEYRNLLWRSIYGRTNFNVELHLWNWNWSLLIASTTVHNCLPDWCLTPRLFGTREYVFNLSIYKHRAAKCLSLEPSFWSHVMTYLEILDRLFSSL